MNGWRTIAIATLVAATLSVLIGPALASDPPDTTITSGPTGHSVITSPQFTFTSDQPGTFECSLDRAAFSACGSPATLKDLKYAEHTFAVRAVNSDGQTDSSPAVATWTVAPSPQEVTSLKLVRPKKRALEANEFRVLSGSANSLAKISRVQVALTFGGPDKNYFPPRCWFVDLRTGELILQTCLLPPYVTVQGTTQWHYTVPAVVRRKIPAGPYLLMVRTINQYGATFFKRFRFTLR